MRELQKYFGVDSFAKISGIAQPYATCPLIDRIINSNNQEIDYILSEITEIEKEIEELEDEYNIRLLNSKIDELNDKKNDFENSNERLESDRIIISNMRSLGVDSRKFFLDLLDESLCTKNNIWFPKEIMDFGEDNIDEYVLYTDDREINRNYEKIIEFTRFWINPKDAFIERLQGKAKEINVDFNYTYEFLKQNFDIFLQNPDNIFGDVEKTLETMFPDLIVNGKLYASDIIDNSPNISEHNDYNNMFFLFNGKGIKIKELVDEIEFFANISSLNTLNSEICVFQKESIHLELNSENFHIKKLIENNELDIDIFKKKFLLYFEEITVYTNFQKNILSLNPEDVSSTEDGIYSCYCEIFNLAKFCKDWNISNPSRNDAVSLRKDLDFELFEN